MPRLTSPHDILSAYSRGAIGPGDAMVMLNLDGVQDLLAAMVDAGHALPRPSQGEIEAQVARAMPLLESVLTTAR